MSVTGVGGSEKSVTRYSGKGIRRSVRGWSGMAVRSGTPDVSQDQVKVHKALHVDGCPPALRGMFTARSKVSVRITRASTAGELHVARCRLDRTKRSFHQRAAMTWNWLPKPATECSSLKMLKHALTGVSDSSVTRVHNSHLWMGCEH